jgi:hypothetical protein
VDVVYISWHHRQVFKGHRAGADAATQDCERFTLRATRRNQAGA